MLRLAKTAVCGILGCCLAAQLAVPVARSAEGGAPAGDPAQKPAGKDKPPARPKPLPVQPHLLKQLPMIAARCGTIAVVKVASAGEVKPDENPPSQEQPEVMMLMRMGAWWGGIGGQGGQAQRARCEVVELIRGEAGTKELAVLCRHFDFNGARNAIWQEMRAEQKDKRAPIQNPSEEDILKRACLTEGETYLLVLMPDETAAPAEGEKPPVLSTAFLPVQAPAKEVLDELRGLVKRIGAYDNPPEMKPGERAAAEKHVADLASPDYMVRSKADDALLAMGPVSKAFLEETVKATKDLEVRERCALILEEIKPLPGAQPDDWAGKAAIMKPAEKPEGEDKDEDEGKAGAAAGGNAAGLKE